MIVKYSVNPYIFTIVLLFNYVVFAMYTLGCLLYYNPLQAVVDPYKGMFRSVYIFFGTQRQLHTMDNKCQ